MNTDTEFGSDGEDYFDKSMTWQQRADSLLRAQGLRFAAYDESGWFMTVNGVRSCRVTDLPARN